MTNTERGSYSLQRRIQVLAFIAIVVTAVVLTIGSWYIERFLVLDPILETRIRAERAVENLVHGDLSPELQARYSKDLTEISELNPDLWYYGEMDGRVLQSGPGAPRYKEALQGSNVIITSEGEVRCAFQPSFFFADERTPPLKLVKNYNCGAESFYVEVDGVVTPAVGGYSWSSLLSQNTVVGISTRRNLVPTIVLAVFLLGAVTLIFGSVTSRIREVSDTAALIGVDESHHTLPESNLPIEILPMVKAVNRAIVRLEEAGKKQGLFLAAAAHELRTPLAIHRAKIEELQDSDLKEELGDDVQQMAEMISQLLALAKLDAVNPQFERIDLSAVVEETCLERGSVAIADGKKLSLEVSDSTAEVSGDQSAIHSAVANLIDNALMYTDEGGTVAVSVDGHTVTISDDGPGIPETDMEQIFEPFFKSPPNKRGHGLGLAIVTEVMRIHGGTVAAHNSKNGGGAVFVLEFPSTDH